MNKFEIHILGCGSALPTRMHYPSAQLVNIREKLMLLDCGEGTQLQFRSCRQNMMKIGLVFITHAHGDHIFGLPGFISTMGLMGRTAPLHIYGPAALRPFIQCTLANYCQGLEYEVEFHAVDTTQHTCIYEDRSFAVWTLPLNHRVPCCGYLLKEKPTQDHIIREKIDFYQIPTWALNNIKAGAGWTLEDGTVIPHEQLTRPAEATRSYAYCTDTLPLPSLSPLIQGIDLLYHEATYGEAEVHLAEKYGHSTAAQAAGVAKAAEVKRLLLGHYSARYGDKESHAALLQEAQNVFPNAILAEEGLTLTP